MFSEENSEDEEIQWILSDKKGVKKAQTNLSILNKKIVSPIKVKQIED
jgi:hypothetical protein